MPPDSEQRLLYVSDLTNNRIRFANRADGRLVGEMGHTSENGGQFFGLHMIAADSQGNVYTEEVFSGSLYPAALTRSCPQPASTS